MILIPRLALKRKRIVTIVGTRPEAIKMAPVVAELARRRERLESILVSTGQHREMLAQVFDSFGLRPDVELELMTRDQSLAGFAARAVDAVSSSLERLRPDVVLVQGDTTTVAAASLAAFYAGVRVGHVEAGLRSHDRRNPFPEEINRRVTGVLADYHFAPTTRARANLLREGVAPESIWVTGNTVVDAIRTVPLAGEYQDARLRAIVAQAPRLMLVTAHRRENHGAPLRDICSAIRRISASVPDLVTVLPVHPNPNVRELVVSLLGDVSRVHLVEPASYTDLLRLLRDAAIILSDSGGIQEEAPSFHTPVLILRETTERPEILESGAALLVGTDPDRIVSEATRLLGDDASYRRMTVAENPFGDGFAAERIVDVLCRDHTAPPRAAPQPRLARRRQRTLRVHVRPDAG